jgi:hypothetical protein
MPWLAAAHAVPIMEQRELVDGFVTSVLAPLLRDLGLASGRLGIDQANLSLIEALRQHLPDVEVTDGDLIMQRARLIKSSRKLGAFLGEESSRVVDRRSCMITRRPPVPRQDARSSPPCRTSLRHGPARPGGDH